MDLRRQLHDVLWARVLFTLALLLGVLWVQIDDHGLVAAELLVSLAVVVVANVPFFLLENRVRDAHADRCHGRRGPRPRVGRHHLQRRRPQRRGRLLRRGPSSSRASSLPAWAPYAAAVAAGVAYALIWELQHVGRLDTTAMVAEINVPPNWMLITVCLHVAAFLLIALLAGRLATALVRSTVQLSAAKADTDEQLRRMQATNEQLRVMSESSRVFLRHQEVDTLMPEALKQIMGASGIDAGFALVLNQNSGELDVKAELGPLDAAFVRKMKELGIADVARGRSSACTRRSPIRGRPAAQGRREGRVPRLPRGAARRQAASCSASSACSTARTRSCRRRRSRPSARSATRWPWSCATSSTTRSSRARTASSRTSTSSRATSWPP